MQELSCSKGSSMHRVSRSGKVPIFSELVQSFQFDGACDWFTVVFAASFQVLQLQSAGRVTWANCQNQQCGKVRHRGTRSHMFKLEACSACAKRLPLHLSWICSVFRLLLSYSPPLVLNPSPPPNIKYCQYTVMYHNEEYLILVGKLTGRQKKLRALRAAGRLAMCR